MFFRRDLSRHTARIGRPRWRSGGLLSLASVLVALLPAGTAVAASFSVPSGEQVILDLRTPDRFRTNFDSTTQVVRSVSNGDCTLTVPSGTLMNISGSAPIGFKAGNKNDWMGLNSGAGGIPCARVGTDQWIAFLLQNGTGQVLEGKTFVQVDVNFNMKKDAQLTVVISLGGSSQSPYMVYSGTTIPAVLGARDIVCENATGSDSGNDSQSVNCRASFYGEGDQIKFTANVGEFSIGGRDSQTVWHLSKTFAETGELNCGETTQRVEGEMDEFGNDFSDVSLQCHRMPNLEALNPSEGQCEDIQYNLELTCEGNEAGDYDPLSACSYALYYASEPLDPGNFQKFQFVCELYTPAFPATFASGKYVLPTIEQYFGPTDSQGADQDFCQGVAPTFKLGTGPSYEFGGNILVNGMPALGQLTSEYESFDAPSPADLDHCPDDSCGVPGQQLGCTIDRRHFQVEDQLADGVVETWVVEFIRWYLRGDYRALLTR